MGGATALVQRVDRHVRTVLSRRGAMAGGGGNASSPQGHGSGHDVLDAAEFLFHQRPLGHVVDRLDLVQYRSRHSREKAAAWSQDFQGSSQGMGNTRIEDEVRTATRSTRGTARRGPVLLRLAEPSS